MMVHDPKKTHGSTQKQWQPILTVKHNNILPRRVTAKINLLSNTTATQQIRTTIVTECFCPVCLLGHETSVLKGWYITITTCDEAALNVTETYHLPLERVPCARHIA